MTDAATTPPPTPAPLPKTANDIFQRLMNFDTLIGEALVKVVYFVGLIGIAVAVVLGVLGALASLAYSPVMGLGLIIAVLIGGMVAVVGWRFACELWLLAFKIFARLGEIRDRLGPR